VAYFFGATRYFKFHENRLRGLGAVGGWKSPSFIDLAQKLVLPYKPSRDKSLMYKTAVNTLVNGCFTHQKQQISETGHITQHGIAKVVMYCWAISRFSAVLYINICWEQWFGFFDGSFVWVSSSRIKEKSKWPPKSKMAANFQLLSHYPSYLVTIELKIVILVFVHTFVCKTNCIKIK